MSVTITSAGRALQRQSLNAVRGAFGFDAAALKPPLRKLPEVVAVVDDQNARHVPEKEGGVRILCKAPGTIHPKRPGPAFASISPSTGAGTQGLAVSVERERVPGDAVPGDAVPGDAVPHDAVPGDAVPDDAVPGEVIPGGAIPDQGVPGEQRPENAAGQRILPLQRRTKKDREQRASETVCGQEPAIDAGHTGHELERAKQETAR